MKSSKFSPPVPPTPAPSVFVSPIAGPDLAGVSTMHATDTSKVGVDVYGGSWGVGSTVFAHGRIPITPDTSVIISGKIDNNGNHQESIKISHSW